MRCRYADCPEQHPVAFDNEDDPNDPRNERVTCPTCRKYMGLPPVEEVDD